MNEWKGKHRVLAVRSSSSSFSCSADVLRHRDEASEDYGGADYMKPVFAFTCSAVRQVAFNMEMDQPVQGLGLS